MAESDFRSRAERQQQGGLEVAVSVLGFRESRKHFGLPLHRADIQPVWISIENTTTETFHLALTSIDPDYFSPSEAVYLSRYRLRRWRNRDADLRFQREAMRWLIPPRVGVSGFVHTNRVLGHKHVHVELIGAHKRYDFQFSVEIPGPEMDYDRILHLDLDKEFGAEPVDLEGLRQRLKDAPFCTTNRKGTRQGDPVNLAIVSHRLRAADVLLRGDWLLTENTNLASSWRTFRSFLLGRPYRHSPVSPLYYRGRRHDVAMQKIRWSIHERNHLRSWRAPWTYEGRRVHFVQISRDIGVRLTRRARILTTHRIDPDVDNARNAMGMDLRRLGCLERYAWLRVSDPCGPDRPRRNLTGDPWWSDGLRAVFFLSDEHVPAEDVTMLDWDPPPLV